MAKDEETPSGHSTIFHVMGQHGTWVQGDYRSNPSAPGPPYWTHNQQFSKVDHENLEIRGTPSPQTFIGTADYNVRQRHLGHLPAIIISRIPGWSTTQHLLAVGVPHIHILRTSRLLHISTYIHSTTQPDPRRYSRFEPRIQTYPIRLSLKTTQYSYSSQPFITHWPISREKNLP